MEFFKDCNENEHFIYNAELQERFEKEQAMRLQKNAYRVNVATLIVAILTLIIALVSLLT